MSSRPISWLRVIIVAIPSVLVIFALLWLFVGRGISSQWARLFQNPNSGVTGICMRPHGDLSLIKREVVVTNADTMRQIMAAIRSAKTYSPNHPAVRWKCQLVISSTSGESYVDVMDTSGQATIIYCKTSPNGLIFDTLRSSTLGHILEQARPQ
jgi:hypothetical protein